MRFFSFVSAILLASTGFVAAAPANGGSVQNMVNVVNSANAQLQSLNTQLGAANGDESKVQSVVTQVANTMTTMVSDLKTASQGVDAADVARDGAFSLGLLGLGGTLTALLGNLIPILKQIVGNVAVNLVPLVHNLLGAVKELATFLKPFVTGTLISILPNVLDVVDNLLTQVAILLGIPAF